MIELKEIFKKFPNKYFVETGTYQGNLIQIILDLGIFEKIFTIEQNSGWYKKATERFQSFPNIKTHLGDSIDILPGVLKKLDEPATIWLDAHECGKGVGYKRKSALLDELDVLKDTDIKNHTIIIDDYTCVKYGYWQSVTEKEVMDKLMLINKKYKITFDTYRKDRPDDILIAEII